VEGRVRKARQSYLTEANAKRREAVHNNISTLILIAKNFKGEGNGNGLTPTGDTGVGMSGDSIQLLNSSYNSLQYSNSNHSLHSSNNSLQYSSSSIQSPTQAPTSPSASDASSKMDFPFPDADPPANLNVSSDEVPTYNLTPTGSKAAYIYDTSPSDYLLDPAILAPPNPPESPVTPQNPLGISLPKEIPLFRDQLPSSSIPTPSQDSVAPWASPSPPSSPPAVRITDSSAADGADVPFHVASAPTTKAEWYYFSNKKSYKYYRVSPTEELSDSPPATPIEVPYYFSVTDPMDGAVTDFPLPEQHPQVLGDFNRRFQEAVKGISVSRRLHITGQDLVKPYLNLIHISQDFIHTATTYGKIIINEVYLPPEKKKIKPINVGGLAGGVKFIVQNILFKFAIDYFDLYGSDDAAAKVAGHDLRGLTHYFECGIEDLCVPLTMLLDYRGFRLICQAVMPISQDTICYGSSDGGEHVHGSDIELYEKLCRAAKMLNLKPHLCRNSQDIMLVSAVDLEGHLGKDKRHYLCDFSRVFPPELPHPNLRSSYMYRLLRPEFLRSLATPLCSDAFSWFIQKTPHERDHNREVALATHYLLNTTIPAFAVALGKQVAEAAANEQLAQFRLTAHIHSNGINIRHCGHLISLIRNIDNPHTDSTIFVVRILLN
jgi:hypothetical protein